MKSSGRFEGLDLGRGLPTSDEDSAALRRAKSASTLSLDEYLRFLDGLPRPTHRQQAAKRGPCGERPFELR
jgi:hypothetical protein